MEPTRVTVRLTARDYGAFIGFIMKSTLLKLQLMLGGGALLWLFTINFGKRPPSSQPQVWPEDWLPAIALVVAALFLPKIWCAFFGWSTARKRARWGSTDYEIRDEGLYYRNDVEEGVRAWGSVQKAARKGVASYLLVSAVSGFIFPDRCFATSEDAARFFEQLLAHLKTDGQPVNWQASKPAGVPTLDPASATVQLEPQDIRRFTSFLPGGKLRKLMVWALFGFGALMAWGTTSSASGGSGKVHGDPLTSFLLNCTPPLIFFVVLGVTFWRLKRRSTYQKWMPGVFIQRTYTVTDEGLFSKSEAGEMITDWRAVQRFVETDTDFYVMIAKRNGFVLPKRCFPTREAAAIFGNQVRLHLEKHAPAALVSA